MSIQEKDRWDEMVDELLPCLRRGPSQSNCNSCARCSSRPAVAAKLREMGEDLATQNKVVVFLRAEIERLKAEPHKRIKKLQDDNTKMATQLLACAAEIDKLEAAQRCARYDLFVGGHGQDAGDDSRDRTVTHRPR